MKKILILALALVPVLFACNKKNANQETAELQLPKWAQNAAKVVFTESAEVETTTSHGTVLINSIEFMRSGRYVAEAVETKATTIILYGSYTVTNGVYNLTGDISANIQIDDDNDSVTINGEDYDANVTPSNVAEGTIQDKACRTWKLDKSNGDAIEIDFGSIKTYKNSITDIVTYLTKPQDNGEPRVKMSDEVKERILNHEIYEISVAENLITVSFTKADTFKGAWTLTSTSFSYDFTGQMNGDLFSSSATGTIEFTGNKAIVKVNVKSGLKELGDGIVIVRLVAVED